MNEPKVPYLVPGNSKGQRNDPPTTPRPEPPTGTGGAQLESARIKCTGYCNIEIERTQDGVQLSIAQGPGEVRMHLHLNPHNARAIGKALSDAAASEAGWKKLFGTKAE